VAGKGLEVGDPIVDGDERFRCWADVNRFMILLRRRVGRSAFPARLLRPSCWRCSTFMPIPVRAAPSEPGLLVTITHGVRDCLRMSFSAASFSVAH
jgi:hypothetical protein